MGVDDCQILGTARLVKVVKLCRIEIFQDYHIFDWTDHGIMGIDRVRPKMPGQSTENQFVENVSDVDSKVNIGLVVSPVCQVFGCVVYSIEFRLRESVLPCAMTRSSATGGLWD